MLDDHTLIVIVVILQLLILFERGYGYWHR